MIKRTSLTLLAAALVVACFGCAKRVQYAIPNANVSLTLPRDLYAHRDYRTEWWYYTGHLKSGDGKLFGFELVFFKRRTDTDRILGFPVRWYSNPAYAAHFAIVEISDRKLTYTERLERDQESCRYGKAGAREDMLWVWNRDWYVKEFDGKHYLYAKMPGYELSLVLTPKKMPVLHGQMGFFQKAEGPHATYYISFTRMEARGALVIGNRPIRVSGLAWNDHEFGSHQLSKEQVGWDWFSIQLDNDHEVMFYLLRRIDGTYDPMSRAVLIEPDGSKEEVFLSDIEFEKRNFWESERTEAKYPVSWKLAVPKWELELEVESLVESCEILTPKSTRTAYWEGPIGVKGSYRGNSVAGRGYLEMCGYEKPLKHLTHLIFGREDLAAW